MPSLWNLYLEIKELGVCRLLAMLWQPLIWYSSSSMPASMPWLNVGLLMCTVCIPLQTQIPCTCILHFTHMHTPILPTWADTLSYAAPPLLSLHWQGIEANQCTVGKYITEQCIQVYWRDYTMRRSVMTHIVGWAPSHILQPSSIPAYSMKTWTDYHHQLKYRIWSGKWVSFCPKIYKLSWRFALFCPVNFSLSLVSLNCINMWVLE